MYVLVHHQRLWFCLYGAVNDIAPGMSSRERVTQSRAVGHEFCLSLADLAKLSCEYKVNPHYRSAAPMKLYNVGDLRAAVMEKFGSVKGALSY